MKDVGTAPRPPAREGWRRDRAATGVAAGPTGGDVPRPPVRPAPGMRPAFLVAGIAVVLIVLFGVTAGVVDQGPGRLAAGRVRPTAVAGTALRALPAGRALRPIEQPGQPPDNVLNAVALPSTATTVSTADNTGTSQYDEQMTFSVPTTEADVITFYRAEMRAARWRIESDGPATHQPGSLQILGQQAGTDGWYWELGVTVSPTTFSPGRPGAGVVATTAPAGAASTGSTRFTVRLIQVNDVN